MKQNKVILLIIVSILLSSIATATIYKSWYQVIQTSELGMDLIVSDTPKAIGLNADTDALHFGKMPPKAGANRRFNVTNNFNHNVRITIQKDDSILSNITGIGPAEFELEPYTTKVVGASVIVPEGLKPGTYNGTVKLIVTATLIDMILN